jgi:hypothetical protein
MKMSVPASLRRLGVKLRLAALDVASGEKLEVLRHPHHGVQAGRVSPDGRWIAFELDRGPDGVQLFMAPFRGLEAIPETEWIAVTEPDTSSFEPAWNPNGSTLYYLSDRWGSRDLWMQALRPDGRPREKAVREMENRIKEQFSLFADRAVRYHGVVLRLATLLLLPALPALAQDAAELIAQLLHRPDVRAKGRIVHTDAAKKQRVFQISLVRKLLPQSANVLLTVAEGPRILIESRFEGPPRIWKDAPTALPPRRWSEPLLESDFTLEDMAEAHLFWPKQTIVRTEKCGDRSCAVLRSEPGDGAVTAYSDVTTWVDGAAMLMVKIVKRRKDAPPKVFTTRGLRKVGEGWGASTVEARTEGAASFSRLVFTSGSAKVNAKASEVDPRTVFAAK